MTTTRTVKQETIAQGLAAQFGIDPERVYFPNTEKPDEPWLPAESLITIARQSGDFQTIDEGFDQFIAPLNQVVHIWRYDSLADLEKKRAARDADPAWGAYLALTEGMVAMQDNKVMRPASFSPAPSLPQLRQPCDREAAPPPRSRARSSRR